MVPEIDRDILVYDDEVTGFAICVHRSGKRAFVLRYRIAGRARHFTIGSWPDWSVTAAREEAKRLKREVDAGNDPLGNRINHRNAPTMSDLIDRYLREHAVQLAPRSFSDRTSLLRKLVEPNGHPQGRRHHAGGCRSAARQGLQGQASPAQASAQAESSTTRDEGRPVRRTIQLSSPGRRRSAARSPMCTRPIAFRGAACSWR